MALKRYVREEGEEGSEEFPNRDSKRQNAFIRDMNNLEPFLRKCVSQEVERVLSSYLRSSPNQIGSCNRSRTWQLHFDDILPSPLFTGCRVEKEDGSLIKILLRDSRSKQVIISGPLSSIKVTIVVLDGDFNKDDQEDWTKQEFENRTVREREGKRPLVTGTLVVSLKEGIGYVEDVSFTDNSSWRRSGKFRLGAITSEENIREGISNAFKVKDHRGESYKKHHPPSPVDEVWRLEKIARDGASHKRLTSCGICNVKDLLRLYVTDPNLLRNILGCKISNKAWNTITEHATGCLLDNNELFLYRAADGTVLVLNSIYQVVGVNFGGPNCLSLNMLNNSQMLLVENLKQFAYKNLNDLVPINDQPFVAHPLLLSSFQTSSYGSPSIQNVNFPVDQETLASVNLDHVKIAPVHAYGGQDGNDQFQASHGETSHQMEAFNSISNNGFVITDPYDELHNDRYSWVSPDSLVPLGSTDQLVVNENFQVETSAWQGNGFSVTPRNQALGAVVSSDFGIRISTSGKPKARWCKIRAVIKWQMVKNSCRKNGKAS
ncbi:hypothetical protein ACH5RR_022881 [Cinchona calisaya]|uniref:Calmodulin-binding protein n=1 Tax=Cinchona calisaya TaxID=153742 RepID=A0ABD2ZAL1_9GENT